MNNGYEGFAHLLFRGEGMKELVWKDVAGFEGFYKVSENGDILSLARVDTYINKGTLVKRNRSEKMLTHKISRTGYATYHLRDATRDIESWPSAHRLVAIAFIPNIDNKPYINHKDGDKLNNHYSNLEWCTAQENTQHAYDNGLAKSVIYKFTKRLEDSPQTKLKNVDIPVIKQLRLDGWTYDAIAKKFDVGLSSIHRICTNQSWKTLES